MITEHLIQQLHALRLRGMADSLQQQLDARECDALRFEERINLMIQNEIATRTPAASGLVRRKMTLVWNWKAARGVRPHLAEVRSV